MIQIHQEKTEEMIYHFKTGTGTIFRKESLHMLTQDLPDLQSPFLNRLVGKKEFRTKKKVVQSRNHFKIWYMGVIRRNRDRKMFQNGFQKLQSRL